ncbi:MAG TPA: hypothetical protein DEP72_09360 [Clostridiales bacterium]|nr:MAG: hypothetical protein A2Y18_03970 [Clostridiales bacterium GWD2_32_19]HCC08348.1 hypothetical protein [Clostridiales bacterium]
MLIQDVKGINKDILNAIKKGEQIEFMSKSIVLASGSRARREIMDESGISHIVIPNTLDEEKAKIEFGLKEELELNSVCEYVKWLSKQKAQTISSNIKNAIILSGDTVVYFDGKILEKPKTIEDARHMLNLLSNNIHRIISGVTIIDTEIEKVDNFSVVSEVVMSQVEPELLARLLENDDTYTHAGAYNISDLLSNHIEIGSGFYDNAKGFPLEVIKGKLVDDFSYEL